MNSLPDIIHFAQAHPALTTVVIIWIFVWKVIALWKASEQKQKVWFVVLLMLNTLGLLEIIYIFIIVPLLEKKKNIPKPTA